MHTVVRGGGLVAIALGGFGIARIRRAIATFDPDTEPEGDRRHKANRRTLTPHEYEQQQLERARRVYAETDPNLLATDPFAEAKPLVLLWWVRPTVFTNGGAVTITLSETQFITFTVPEMARPGVVLEPSMCPPGVRPFNMCVCAFRVHPDDDEQV